MSDLNLDNIPSHVAIIMDGNGRWAKKRFLPVSMGHSKGVKRVEELVETASQLGVKFLTVYAFSTENWKREKTEVDHLIKLLFQFYESKFKKMMANNVIFKVIGSRVGLSQDILDLFKKMELESCNNTGMTFNLAFNYGGRLELVDAFKQMQLDGISDITEDIIGEYLYTKGHPDVDLMIRTSGEKRLSNFLIWQNSYSEFVFVDEYWPDFKKANFLKCVKEYQDRQRRFGAR